MRKTTFSNYLPGLILAGVILFFNLVLFNIYVIPTRSMEPTIKANSFCIGLRLPYLLSDPQVSRGDIITFDSSEEKKILCKRVIGIAGDTIEFRDGYVYINGQVSEEPYVKNAGTTYCDKTFEVPDNTVFCMGDNRENSRDCRFFEDPYIKLSDIKTKILKLKGSAD